jgi:hypothetical protein
MTIHLNEVLHYSSISINEESIQTFDLQKPFIFLEMECQKQKNLLQSYASCSFFIDDISASASCYDFIGI